MKPCSCRHPLLLLLLCSMLAGCMPSRALPQFQAYDFAFAKVQDTGDLLLDHVAAAEKQEGQRVFRRRNKDIDFGVDLFQPENAAYFAGSIDPPLTAAYRRSLAVIAGYNATLLAIAEGRSLAELKTTASRLGKELGGLLTLAGVASSLTPLQPALKLLGAAVNEALVAASRAALKKNAEELPDGGRHACADGRQWRRRARSQAHRL